MYISPVRLIMRETRQQSEVRYKRHHLTLSGRDDHEASIGASTFVPALPSSPAFLQLHIDNIIATVGPGATTGHSLI